jgi:NAD(P)-dependent dehydrogenase (short-subunit alcohol dehydrogenase family)
MVANGVRGRLSFDLCCGDSSMLTTTLLSRRSTLLAGVGLALGATALPAIAQAPAQQRTPENEDRWARMGVSLKGKTALVTGSTDGLGKEVARQLGALGARVIVHGRNQERGEEVAGAIRSAGGDAVFYRADLASLAAVDAFASQIRNAHDRLDLLINNAAAVSGPQRQMSADGHELAFAVNYLAHFLLTYRLLPLLESSAPARVVNVSSLGQTPLDFADLMMERSYDAGDAYRRSKLAQIMFTIDLAAELEAAKVTVNSLHPARSMNTARVLNGGFQPLSTVEEGAEATMQLAVSPELAGRTGLYFNGLNEARANAQAYDESARAQLRALSRALTGVTARS